MVKPSTLAELDSIRITNDWENVLSHNLLVDCDLIFCSGHSISDRAIKHMTNSIWNHVGIVWAEKDYGPFVIEAKEFRGVRVLPFSDYIGQNYNGYVGLAKINSSLQTHCLRRDVLNFALSKLALPYNYSEIFKMSLRILFNQGKRKGKDQSYICSELVWEAFQSAGITLATGEGGFISPEDIWKDERVEFLLRLQ